MKKKTTFGTKKKQKQKKLPGKARREEEKKLRDTLRGERIPRSSLIPDKREKSRESRLEKEIRSA
ncbi:MAG: hypothetical protein IKE16_04240 [Solobacterium sp.]|nr:hypothetical protein [Solobacterium sp.]MBR2793837.1 hypothetical protein [Solobacterium sp.]